MKVLYLFILLQVFVQASAIQKQSAAVCFLNNLPAPTYSSKIIGLSSNTFGYEIYADQKLFIRQLIIPGIPGNSRFQRKADAEKVAALVVSKLSKGMMPPSIDKKELDSLQIRY